MNSTHRCSRMRNLTIIMMSAYVAKKGLCSPLVSLLMLGVLSVSFMVGELPISLEGYYSYPFVAMRSNYIVEVQYSGNADKALVLARDQVIGYGTYGYICDMVMVGFNERATPTRLFAIHKMSDSALSNTEFNSETLRFGEVGRDSVIIDRNLAETLGVKKGQSIYLYCGNKKEIKLRVSNLMLPYASTRGIIVDDSQLPGLAFDRLVLYADAIKAKGAEYVNFANADDDDDVSVSIDTRSERIRYQEEASSSFLPYMRTGFMEWLSLGIALVGAVAYGLACFKMERTSVYESLSLVGMTGAGNTAIFVIGRVAASALLCALGALIGSLLLWAVFYRLPSFVEVMSSTLLEIAVCASGFIVVALLSMRTGAR